MWPFRLRGEPAGVMLRPMDVRSGPVVVMVLVVALTGAAVPPAMSAVSAPASGVAASSGLRLHEDDSGRTVRVHVGERIHVRLPNDSFGGYRRPTAAGDELVRKVATGGYPTDYPARAVFVAKHRGRTDITSTTDYACLHSEPACALPQRTWTVHVRVRR